MKNLLLFILIPLVSYSQVQIGEDINGEAAEDGSGLSISLSSTGSIIAIGAIRNDGNGPNSGHVRIYENINDSWIQIGNDIDGEAEGDQFGASVSLSSDGTIVAVGAHLNDDNGQDSGHVRIYENINDSWIQIGDDINGESSNDFFGISTALSSDGTIVAIGDFNNVRVFENTNDTWTPVNNVLSGEAPGDGFGSFGLDLSSNGQILAVGAALNDKNGNASGHARIFFNDSNEWVQIGNDINGEEELNWFGSDVSLSSNGTIVAIGARFNDGESGNLSGHVRIFENIDNNWNQLGNDIDGESMGDESGSSVSLSSDGKIVAIGARTNDANGTFSGHVRIYRLINDSWIQVGSDIDGENEFNQLGLDVDLSSNGAILAASAFGDNENVNGSGQVSIFDLSEVLTTPESSLTTFSFYPNPAKNNFTITLSDSESLQKATIYNSLGQEIINSTEQTIDVSYLSKGLYVVEVQTTTGKGSEKLIIN